ADAAPVVRMSAARIGAASARASTMLPPWVVYYFGPAALKPVFRINPGLAQIFALFRRSRKKDARPLHLFDHLVGAREQRKRNGETKGLGRLEIDDQLELCRLHDREIARIGAFDYLVDVKGSSAVHVRDTWAIRH